MFSQWGFIYLGVGSEDPASQRAVIEHDGLRTTIVAVPGPAELFPSAPDAPAGRGLPPRDGPAQGADRGQ